MLEKIGGLLGIVGIIIVLWVIIASPPEPAVIWLGFFLIIFGIINILFIGDDREEKRN